MAKYDPLSFHLASINESTLDLTFHEVEEIIGDTLPDSVQYPAWWSNEIKGTHNWAHKWRIAGWQTKNVDCNNKTVTFVRTKQDPKITLAMLVPNTRTAIYDLLNRAGISTDNWHIKQDGSEVIRFKSNPNYCYNWSFGTDKGFALCVWHDTLQIRDENIVFTENLRELSRDLKKLAVNSDDSKQRSRANNQSLRAANFDEALKTSFLKRLPVTIIINVGNRRQREELGENSSESLERLLDPVKWYVQQYDQTTGDAILVRGVNPFNSDESITVSEEELDGPPDSIQLRAISIRRGQHKFRQSILKAYNHTCAVTGCQVLKLLEAAHIMPHAKGPNYRISNGILLRTDIHTLFDEGLLAFDSNYRIRISSILKSSEYAIYDGKKIKLPDLPSEMPCTNALMARYQELVTS